MGFQCFFCRFPNSQRPQTFRSAAQASRLASALGGCPQVISGLVASSTADFHSEDPDGVELGFGKRAEDGADGDGLMRIGWKAFIVSVNLCVQAVSMSSPVQVLPPLPIPRQMSSIFCGCWPQTWMYAPSLPPKRSSHSAVSPWRSAIFQRVIPGVRKRLMLFFAGSEGPVIRRDLAPARVRYSSKELHRRTCVKDQLARARAVL